MLKLRSAAGIVLAAILATVLVAAPSDAAPAVANLACTAPSGSNRDVTLDLVISGLAAAATTPVQVTIMVDTALAKTETFDATAQWHHVFTSVIPTGLRSGSVNVAVTVGSQVHTCSVAWSAFAISSWSLPKGLAAGKSGPVAAVVSSTFGLGDSYAVLQYLNSTGWHDAGTSWFDSAGRASFTMSGTRWKNVRLLVVPEDEPSYANAWVSTPQIFDVKVATATIASKPSKVVQTHNGTVVVNYGSYATTGSAALQRKSAAGAWVTVKKVTLAHGTATVTWKPGATYTYRIAVTPSGSTTKHTASFSVKYVPLLVVSAPASAKKKSTVTFTLTQQLAPPLYATLQRWNGKKWVTVKTFVVSSTVQKVAAKLTGTSKWRVTAAGHTSAAITVKAK